MGESVTLVVLQNCTGCEERWGERSVCCQPAKLVDDLVLGEDIPLGDSLALAIVEHGHGFMRVQPRYV
jgi:hypothetical protein